MKILAVDDENLQLNRLTSSIKEACNDCVVVTFNNPLLALDSAKKMQYDVAFLDIEMPGITGTELAKKLKSINPKINIIFVTGYQEYALDALKLHASGYVTKPATKEKIQMEIDNLRYPMPKPTTGNIIRVQCFGNFEVFANNEPLKFERSKTKELFAYLIDRKGACCTMGEISAVLWEDTNKQSYLRNLISDLQKTLKNAGADDIFVKKFNECYILAEKIDCDFYDYEKNIPYAVKLYRGEYMMQYSWAEETNAQLLNY